MPKFDQLVIRMSGPGSDKIKTDNLRPVQRQGMLAQALLRLTEQYMGLYAHPIPLSFDVQWHRDKDGFQYVILVPRMVEEKKAVDAKGKVP